MQSKFILIFIFSLLLWSCNSNDLTQNSSNEPSEWVTAKVAVVLPLSGNDSDKGRYDRIFNLFEDNVIKAQLNSTKGVRLELEWFDENTVDINKLANELYDRDDIKAIIGPLNNDHIETMANVMYDKGIPMFVMTSSEDIVRRYSSGTAGVAIKKPFMWSLATTDITQSQLILAQFTSMGIKKMSIISASNKYGETFNRWIPYYANEMELDIVDRVQYSSSNELENEMNKICKSDTEVVICALHNTDDVKTVLQTT